MVMLEADIDERRMEMAITGRIALVTGGAKGIGKEIVRALLNEGATTVAVGRNQSDLDAAAREFASIGRFEALQADVTRIADIEDVLGYLAGKYGKVDILVNNAGTAGPTTPLIDLNPDDWFEVLTSNLTSTFYCCKVFAPEMVRQKSGTIINMSSVSGKKPLLNRSGYCSAKMGVIGLTRTLALELGPHGVTVNAICPGYVEGDRIQEVFRRQAAVRGVPYDEVLEEFTELSPLGRLVSPTDISGMVIFLSSEAGRNITGQDLNVNAGVIMY